MSRIAVAELRPGHRIRLTGSQTLWDFTAKPARELRAGSELTVESVSPLATSRPGRQPYDLVLLTDDGARIRLEISDGRDRLDLCDSVAGSA